MTNTGGPGWYSQLLRFKWGALLLTAAMGWLAFALLHFCWPYVMGFAFDTSSGYEVAYVATLNMKRIGTYNIETSMSKIIAAGNTPAFTASNVRCYTQGELMSISGYWFAGPIFRRTLIKRGLDPSLGPVPPDIDSQAEYMLDWVARYLADDDWQRQDGIRCGISPAGKAQLMRNMLEVLRRHGESKYVTPLVIPQLLRPLDHPAGPDEVPTAKQIFRKAAQFM